MATPRKAAPKFKTRKHQATLEKPDWDDLYQRYATAKFIDSDPIQLAWQYQTSSQAERELVSFLVCMFAYGGRGKIIDTMGGVLQALGPSPLETLHATPESQWVSKKLGHGFYYRFNTRHDLLFLLSGLKQALAQDGTLEKTWQRAYQKTNPSFKNTLSRFQQRILQAASLPAPKTYGMQFLFAEPAKNSAAKRLNMFLRWVVRDDAVDQGLWKKALSPSELMIPLDTHVSRLSREHGLTERKSNDWKTAEEITNYFRAVCPEDPIKYDLALMGLGTMASKNSHAF
jgi:uncharacterized protein (TIGR02757 family)